MRSEDKHYNQISAKGTIWFYLYISTTTKGLKETNICNIESIYILLSVLIIKELKSSQLEQLTEV